MEAPEFDPRPVRWGPENTARFWDYYEGKRAIEHLYFAKQVGEHVALLAERSAGLRAAKRILDVSCGRGDLIEHLLKFVKNGQMIFATDMSAESVTTTNTRFDGVESFAGAQCITDLSDLPENYYDLILMTEVIEHLSPDETPSVLRKLATLAAPGGRVLITTPNDENLKTMDVMCPDCGCTFHRWQHQQSWTLERLRELVIAAQLTPCKSAKIRWGGTRIKRFLYPALSAVGVLEKTGIYCIAKNK